MKKKKSILHLCEATFLILLLILISTLYLLKYLQDPAISYVPMLHLIQLILTLVVVTLALTLIQRELLSRLLVNAFRDITGIHNKTSLENKIAELSDMPSTFGIGVMMFDLNNLKHVNDTYGHEKGDEFIQTFTYCLTRILDSDSFLARYGGDEFIIIQQNTDLEHLQHMEHKLDNLVQDYNNQATLPLSYAIGYEISRQNHYFMMENLINAADKKMYQDKSQKKLAAIKQHSGTVPPANAVIPTASSELLADKIQQLQKSTGARHSISLISADVENFHYINDKYGYPLGNEILNIVYEELASSPLSLFTTRVFSDVFICIADTANLTDTALLTQVQLLDKRISHRIQNTYHISFFRANYGIYKMDDPGVPPENIISCANVARRLAKKMISHCCIYSNEIDRQEKMQAEILHSFHPALNNHEFQIYFQPKVKPCLPIDSNEPSDTPHKPSSLVTISSRSSSPVMISSAEVLVRWIKNGKPLWTPDIYIPLFEQNGFVITLDYYVYEQAFQWLQKYAKFLPEHFQISLNVSPLHFEQPQIFIEKIREFIQTYQVDTSHLTFEITESTYVNNTEAVNQVIRSLKQQNIRISMDDFGSGYSSLNTLKDLLFDEVKIDRKFLGDTLTENAKIVLQEVFHMLKRMGKSIVCEGVETEEIAEFLKNEGCDEIQGFLYYRPMCREDFEELLLNSIH